LGSPTTSHSRNYLIFINPRHYPPCFYLKTTFRRLESSGKTYSVGPNR
jgi:hypothetical protein